MAYASLTKMAPDAPAMALKSHPRVLFPAPSWYGFCQTRSGHTRRWCRCIPRTHPPQSATGWTWPSQGGGVWKCLGVSWSPTAPSRPGPQGVHTPTRPSEPSNHVPHRPLGVRSGCLGCLPTPPPPRGGLARLKIRPGLPPGVLKDVLLPHRRLEHAVELKQVTVPAVLRGEPHLALRREVHALTTDTLPAGCIGDYPPVI